MPDAGSAGCSPSGCRNVSKSERGASAVLGGALLLMALRQLSPAAWLLLGGAAAMSYRAATGYCPAYDALDIDTTKPRRVKTV